MRETAKIQKKWMIVGALVTALIALIAAVVMLRPCGISDRGNAPLSEPVNRVAVQEPGNEGNGSDSMSSGANGAPSPEIASPRVYELPVEDLLPPPPIDEEYVEAVLAVPPHSWQKERAKNIVQETIEETIQNFAHFDDLMLAQTSFEGGGFELDPRAQSLVVTRLARVRRVLEEGRADPEKVIPHLRRVLADALTGWPDARRQKEIRMNASVGYSRSEPDNYDTLRVGALAATYLLAELGDHEALPVMAECFRCHKVEKPYESVEELRFAPVPPALTLYAMHRLVSSYPVEELSPEARRLRETYLKSATCLPAPQEVTVTRWNAGYDESDPRIMMMDPEGRVLRGQPTMKLAVYPWQFDDGTPTFDHGVFISERAKSLFSQLERFVVAAFPEYSASE